MNGQKSYTARRRAVRNTLIKWGITEKIVSNIINPPHKLGDIEKIIRDTEKRRPGDPARYFLKGLNYYRVRSGRPAIHRSLTADK